MFDFNIDQFDIYNIGAWPKIVKSLAVLTVVILIIVTCNWLMISSKSERLSSLLAEEVKTKQFYVQKQKLLINIKNYKKQLAVIESRLDKLVTQLPSMNEVPNLIDQVSQAGRESGLSLKKINILPEKRFRYYIELPINITVSGNYHQIGNFISKVSYLPRIITFHDFNLEMIENKNKLKTLELQILAKTYRYISDGGTDDKDEKDNNENVDKV